jgi:hypothetical protein
MKGDVHWKLPDGRAGPQCLVHCADQVFRDSDPPVQVHIQIHLFIILYRTDSGCPGLRRGLIGGVITINPSTRGLVETKRRVRLSAR